MKTSVQQVSTRALIVFLFNLFHIAAIGKMFEVATITGRFERLSLFATGVILTTHLVGGITFLLTLCQE